MVPAVRQKSAEVCTQHFCGQRERLPESDAARLPIEALCVECGDCGTSQRGDHRSEINLGGEQLAAASASRARTCLPCHRRAQWRVRQENREHGESYVVIHTKRKGEGTSKSSLASCATQPALALLSVSFWPSSSVRRPPSKLN